MQSEREFRAAVHLRDRGLPSVADAPAAAASLEFCGYNVFCRPDHGHPVLSGAQSTEKLPLKTSSLNCHVVQGYII